MAAQGTLRGGADGVRPQPPLDLGDLIVLLWQRKILILAVSVAFALLAGLATVFMAPVYRAQALLVPGAQRSAGSGLGEIVGQVEGLASFAGIDLPSGGSPKEAIALLKSRALGEELIRRKSLIEVLGGDRPTLRKAYAVLDERVRKVKEDRESGLVTLSIDWKDPVVAAELANSLIALANEVTRARAISEAESSLQFLNVALANAKSNELREAIFRLMEAEVKARMLASVRQDPAFRVIDAATVADTDEFVWPKRVLLIVFALLAGLMAGILVAYAGVVRARGRAAS